MKRSLILCMILGLVASSMATAEAKGRKQPTQGERTVEASYIGPWLPFGNWDCAPPHGRGCVTIATRKGESYLNATVTDAHGQPVLVNVWSEYNAQGSMPLFHGYFCGETTSSMRVPSGVTLKLWVGAWPTTPTCGLGMATTGTVTATLSNLP